MSLSILVMTSSQKSKEGKSYVWIFSYESRKNVMNFFCLLEKEQLVASLFDVSDESSSALFKRATNVLVCNCIKYDRFD